MHSMGTVIKFILLVLIVYFFINVYRTVKRLFGSAAVLGGRATPFSKGEECPSCHARIRVPEQPGSCPKCQSPLGRSPEGKLLIRVN
jgi:uncharacterized paraquat-inducible protein A